MISPSDLAEQTSNFTIIDNLIEQKLTIDEFCDKATEHGITIIRPEETATTEMRMNMSRFFPRLNEMDIVVGGSFK